MRFGPRFFCVDMGGFAFDSALLRAPQHAALSPPAPYEAFASPRWNYTGRRRRLTKGGWDGGATGPPLSRSGRVEWRGGETEFLQQLLPRGFPEDLQPLANCGHDVLVYHNGLVGADAGKWRPTIQPPVFCKSDGWG